MSRTLYISNLPFSATEHALSVKFATCGTVVSVRIAMHPETGRSKGFGYIEMASLADAQKAINRLNLSDYDGRLMSVNKVRTAAAN